MLLHTLSCTIILCTPGNLPAQLTAVRAFQGEGALEQNRSNPAIKTSTGLESDCKSVMSHAEKQSFQSLLLALGRLILMPKAYQVRLCLRIQYYSIIRTCLPEELLNDPLLASKTYINARNRPDFENDKAVPNPLLRLVTWKLRLQRLQPTYPTYSLSLVCGPQAAPSS